MQTAIIHPFISNNRQAVYLPQDFAYPQDTQLIMTKENDTVLLKPVTNLSQVPQLFAQIGEQTKDFDEKIERTFVDNQRDW